MSRVKTILLVGYGMYSLFLVAMAQEQVPKVPLAQMELDGKIDQSIFCVQQKKLGNDSLESNETVLEMEVYHEDNN